jgi:hypothetical protein
MDIAFTPFAGKTPIDAGAIDGAVGVGVGFVRAGLV